MLPFLAGMMAVNTIFKTDCRNSTMAGMKIV
jgi:hypothetical protein